VAWSHPSHFNPIKCVSGIIPMHLEWIVTLLLHLRWIVCLQSSKTYTSILVVMWHGVPPKSGTNVLENNLLKITKLNRSFGLMFRVPPGL
jgi:hypothetical protein